MKILMTLILTILISSIGIAAVGEGGVGISAVGEGGVGITAVGEGGVGITAVGEGGVGITDLGNGLIQMCFATRHASINCAITNRRTPENLIAN